MKAKKAKLNIDALNLKLNDVDSNKMKMVKASAQFKTKTAQKIADKLLQNIDRGQAVGGPPNWEHKDAVKNALLHDLRIIAKLHDMKARCIEHGNELIFHFDKATPKKTTTTTAAKAA